MQSDGEVAVTGYADDWSESQYTGHQRVAVIPPEQGYKDKAQGADIPANSTLVFSMDILGTM